MEIKKNMNLIVKMKLDSAIAKNNWLDIKDLAKKGYLAAIEAYYNKVIPDHESFKEDNGFTFIVCCIMVNEFKKTNVSTLLVDNLDAGILDIYCDKEPVEYYAKALAKGIKDSDIEYALKIVEAKSHSYYEFLRAFLKQLLAYKGCFDFRNLGHFNFLEPNDRIKVMSYYDRLTPVLAAYLLCYGKNEENAGNWENKYELEQVAEVAHRAYPDGYQLSYMCDLFGHEKGYEILEKLKSKEEYSFFNYGTINGFGSYIYWIEMYDPIKNEDKKSDTFLINLAKFISEWESCKEIERNIYKYLYYKGHKEYAPIVEPMLKNDFQVSDGYEKLDEAYGNGYVHARYPLALCLLNNNEELIKKHKERIVELLSGEIEDGNEGALADFEKLSEFNFIYTRKLNQSLLDLYKRDVNMPPNVLLAYYNLKIRDNTSKDIISREEYTILKKSACKKYVPAMKTLVGLNNSSVGIRSENDKKLNTSVTDEPEYEFCLMELYKAGDYTYMGDFFRNNSICDKLSVEEKGRLYKKYYGKYEVLTYRLAKLYLEGNVKLDDDEAGRKQKYELLTHMETYAHKYRDRASYEIAGCILRKEFVGIAKLTDNDAGNRLVQLGNGEGELAAKANLMYGIMRINELRLNDRYPYLAKLKFIDARNYLEKAKKMGNKSAEALIRKMDSCGL